MASWQSKNPDHNKLSLRCTVLILLWFFSCPCSTWKRSKDNYGRWRKVPRKWLCYVWRAMWRRGCSCAWTKDRNLWRQFIFFVCPFLWQFWTTIFLLVRSWVESEGCE
jgi:hypothetical protein